jgi:hypothetical protein
VKKIPNTDQVVKKSQSLYSIQKIRRDKAKNALLETKISLEMASRELSKFIDEFHIARTDEEKANVLNQCIWYLAQNCVSNLQLSQLPNRQSKLTQLEPINLYDK